MAIAGAAFGASQSLEEILAAQMFKAKLQQQQAMDAKRLEMDQQRLSMQSQRDADDEAFRGRQEDRLGAQVRKQDNAEGVRRMIGEGITRRVPLGDMQGMAFAEGIDLPQAPKVERDPIADHREKAKIDAEFRPKPQGPSGPKEPRWVRMEDGSVVDINGIAPKGSKPYDAVAERTSAPVNRDEALDTAREAKRIASALVGHKGFNGAFGVMDSWMPTLRQDTADAEALRDTLTSLLTMENMGKMKGVLSDSDMKVLKQASSTINSRISESAAKAELNRIIQVMGNVAGDTPPAPDAGGGDATATAQALIEKARAARGGKP